MALSRFSRLGIGAVALGLGLLAHAPAQDAKDVSYERDIRPLVAKYCHKCHGGEKPKANLDLTAFADEKAVLAARKTWKKVYDLLAQNEMPPEDKPQPTAAEREKMVLWVEGALQRPDPNAPRDPGRVVLRRLSRVEYNNTVRDLLALDLRLADDFPSDDVGYGFDNIGDVLSLPPLLMEKYVAAAEKILDKAVITEDLSKPREKRLQGESMDITKGGNPDVEALILFGNGEGYASCAFPQDANYVFRVRAGGDQVGPVPVRMRLKLDDQEVKLFDVPAARTQPQIYEIKVAVRAGKRRVAVEFTNDYFDPRLPKARSRYRNLLVDYVDVVGPVDVAPPEPPESHKRLFVSKPGAGKTPRQAAQEILAAFLPKAFRRPAAAGEVERFLRLYDLAEKQGDGFEQAMKLPLAAVLVSPHFLFRIEADRTDDDPKGVRPVTDFELASRLSYFLWSSMPDAELFDLAGQGKLRDSAILDAQIARMIRDPRSQALAANFGLQWLQLRRLETHTPDPRRFPAYDKELRQAVREEPARFFDAVLRDDRSILEFIDADWTVVNERLARHYGLEGVKGPEFRRVELKDPRRGGVLTMAGILTATSESTRTSAVKRGKWVLETILGTPPPPPLPDAGILGDEPPEQATTSVRQRLERHRRDPICASCHKRMDPLGFGFENFDGIGAWREKDGPVPVDSSAVLPDGRAFSGPVELKKILLTRKDDFVRCIAEKMLTYALGRGVEYYDLATVKAIGKAMAENKYRMSVLVREIAKSYPFQNRRNRGAVDEVKK
jgi:hypothetical protein